MSTTNGLTIRPFQITDKADVIELWHRCNLVVPWNDPDKDIMTKLAFQPDLFFVGTLDGSIVATVMAGYEGHRGWINYLAVAPDCQGQGLGRRMMTEAETRLQGAGCPKINVQVRTSNLATIAFYERLGYAKDEVVNLGKRL